MNKKEFIKVFLKELEDTFKNDDVTVTYIQDTGTGRGDGFLVNPHTDSEYSMGPVYYANDMYNKYISGISIKSICQEIYGYIISNLDNFINTAMSEIQKDITINSLVVMCMKENDPRFNKSYMIYKTIGNAVMVLYTFISNFSLTNEDMVSPVTKELLEKSGIKIDDSIFEYALLNSMEKSMIQFSPGPISGIFYVRDAYDFSDGFYLTFNPFLNDMCDVMGVNEFYIIPVEHDFALFFTADAAKDVKDALNAINVRDDELYIPGVFHYNKETGAVVQEK